MRLAENNNAFEGCGVWHTHCTCIGLIGGSEVPLRRLRGGID
jgi:hypothetical protein